jgi:hypothetical protein
VPLHEYRTLGNEPVAGDTDLPEDVLDQLAADGTVDRRQLAHRLDLSPQLLDDMLAQLAAAGYVERYSLHTACTPVTCTGCPAALICTVHPSDRSLSGASPKRASASSSPARLPVRENSRKVGPGFLDLA